MTDITPHFPTTSKVKSPRPNQEYLFDEITTLFECGETNISVCAPTGIGKSPLAVALLRYMSNQGKAGLITSPLNELVDQYDNDFGEDYLCTIKGRKHYACAADYSRSCAEGFCQEKTCAVDPTQPRYCMNPATIQLCKQINECPCVKCIYKTKMKAYKKSSKGNTNFTLFQKGVTNDPYLIIIDECDETESFIRMGFTVSVPEVIDWDNFEDHILSLEDWKQHYLKVVTDLKESLERTTNPAHKASLLKDLNRAKRRCGNIRRVIDDYENHGEPWAVTNDLYVGSTKYEPVTTDRFLTPMLKNKLVIQMSATPQSLLNYYPIEVDSPFPPEIRGWKYNPIGKMSLNHRDNTIPKLAKFLCELEGKTLVHCYDEQTRVLTKNGFKFFKDVISTDLIATLSKDGFLEYQYPINVINYDYVGDMISFKNTRLDLLVTPEHRMFISSVRGDTNFGYSFKTANQLKEGVKLNGFKKAMSFKIKKWCNWVGVSPVYWTIPSVTYRPHNKSWITPPKQIPIKTWLRFLGWYISEGSTNYREDISQYQVQIAQKDIENTEIPSLIKEMGYIGYINKYVAKTTFGTVLSEKITITDKALSKYLRDTFGNGCYNKHLTKELLNLSPDLLNEFIDTYSQGDGHIRGKYIQMYTSSTMLKDQLMEIGLKIGYQSNVGLITSQDWKKWKNTNTGDIWVIGYSYENRHAIVKPNDIKTQNYNGSVGCVEVPNSVIFVERNGKSAWCGNCLSYATAEKIGRALQGICDGVPLIQIGKEKPLEYNDGNGIVTRKDAVTKFKQSKDPNQILLSVKMDRGVDFPEPDITNNVIAALPFPNPVDPLTIAKNKLLGKDWQNEQMANNITQMLGRVNRNTDKTTITYIIPSEWAWWFKKNRKHFKNHFLEAQLR